MHPDYTIMHPCGLEEYETSFKRAKEVAIAHAKTCKVLDYVSIDYHDGTELNGKWWSVYPDGITAH